MKKFRMFSAILLMVLLVLLSSLRYENRKHLLESDNNKLEILLSNNYED